jgi:NADH pyrophosphatase NudC (nudix superfamily)
MNFGKVKDALVVADVGCLREGVRAMATCKDCVHYEVCKIWCGEANIPMSTDCDFFKNKADFVEVKHGEWRNVYMSSPSSFVGSCSECKRSSDIPPPEQARYCPRCGADMRKGENNAK